MLSAADSRERKKNLGMRNQHICFMRETQKTAHPIRNKWLAPHSNGADILYNIAVIRSAADKVAAIEINLIWVSHDAGSGKNYPDQWKSRGDTNFRKLRSAIK